jgi:signal transduction histidine kinase
MKVSTKLYFGTVLQFVVAITLVVLVLYMQEKQYHDSVVINLAGRQRMLSQKMTKEILLFSKGAFAAEKVLNTIEVFDQTLKALTYGGKAPLDLDQTTFTALPAPETKALVTQLNMVESLWRSFSEVAKRYMKDKNAWSFEYLRDNNGLLLQEMNKAVFLMDEAAAGKVASLRKVLLWGSAALCLLFFLTLLIVRKNVQIIFEQLKQSYEKVQRLNHAKDCVMHHLSHELKTPIAILDASLGLLQKRLAGINQDRDRDCHKILVRARKSLGRLIEMHHGIGDILRTNDYKTHTMLSALLDACADELEVLVTEELDENDIIGRLRQRIDELFGLRKSVSKEIHLGKYVNQTIEELRPRFAHSRCRINTRISSTAPVWIPPEVLGKIVEGLIRNAIENTPAGGRIDVTVCAGESGPEFKVKDNGVGISEENQRLLLENYFTAYEPSQYSSRKPYDFNAGGKGLDLLRMKIFSELYHFKIRLFSRRCGYISKDANTCPGNVAECVHYNKSQEYQENRGTTVAVQFFPIQQFAAKEALQVA